MSSSRRWREEWNRRDVGLGCYWHDCRIDTIFPVLSLNWHPWLRRRRVGRSIRYWSVRADRCVRHKVKRILNYRTVDFDAMVLPDTSLIFDHWYFD